MRAHSHKWSPASHYARLTARLVPSVSPALSQETGQTGGAARSRPQCSRLRQEHGHRGLQSEREAVGSGQQQWRQHYMTMAEPVTRQMGSRNVTRAPRCSSRLGAECERSGCARCSQPCRTYCRNSYHATTPTVRTCIVECQGRGMLPGACTFSILLGPASFRERDI